MEQTAVACRGTAAGTARASRLLADDLIWASRLRAAVERAGAVADGAKDAAAIDAPFAVIDLGGRAYDGIEAVRVAASAGATVLAVAQHEDVDLRKAALAAGAQARPLLQQDVQRRPGRHHATDRGHPVSRPTISAERYEQRIARGPGAAARGGRIRVAHRRRAGSAVADRLRR